MAEMVRKQIYLDRHLEQLIKEQAEATGRSQAEVIRLALERFLSPSAQRSEVEAWRELKDFFEARSALPSSGKTQRWTREELYERRR